MVIQRCLFWTGRSEKAPEEGMPKPGIGVGSQVKARSFQTQ